MQPFFTAPDRSFLQIMPLVQLPFDLGPSTLWHGIFVTFRATGPYCFLVTTALGNLVLVSLVPVQLQRSFLGSNLFVHSGLPVLHILKGNSFFHQGWQLQQ